MTTTCIISVITSPPLPLDVLRVVLDLACEQASSEVGKKAASELERFRRASRRLEKNSASESVPFASLAESRPTASLAEFFFRPRWEPVRRLIRILKACHI